MKHKQTLRRGLSILLSLVLCLSLLPATALAEGTATATETADFTTDAEAALALLNAAKTEGAADSEWDPYTSTLTLNGVNFTTTAETAVKLPDGATIVLAEGTTNTIASTNSSTNVFGIHCQDGSLNISGGGSLTINVSYTNSTMWYMAVGIYAGSVTMTGGTVNIVASNSKYSSYGVFASKDLSVTGGHLTANITTNQEMGYGLCCQDGEIDIGAAATVDVTVTNSGVVAMYGIYNRADTNGIADNGNINLAGTVTVKKGSSATGNVYGIANSGNGYNPNGVISVTGGSVTVTDAYCGISTATAGHTEAFSDVVISGGTVNITSSEAHSRGIVSWKNGVSISGGAVTVSTVDPALALDDADSTNQTGLVNISGGAEVSLTSSDSMALVVQGDSSVDSTRTHQIDLASGGSVTIKSTSSTENNVLFPEQGYFILGSHTAITEGNFVNSDINAMGGRTLQSNSTSKKVVVAYQLSATPSATVSDATVSGNKGVVITDTDVTVTLLNDTFANTLSGSWITNLPAGLSQTVTRVDDTHATITISGTPTATRVAAMAITIPADQLTSNAALTVTANANAKFDIIVPVYPVRFNANGGTGTMTAVTTTGDYTLPTCTFTAPSGKQFKGWALTATGEVISGTSITVTEDTTLYAVWEDIPATTYTVRFNANGGSGEMTDVTDVSGSYTLPACTFTPPEGKQFKAWSVNGTEYAAGAGITVSSDTTVTAIWEDIPDTTSVEINETNFPDATFRDYVSDEFDDNSDGVLSDDEIAEANRITCNYREISNLKGIEHFTALTALNCSNNKLTNLDVSSNTALEYLNCSGNQLTELEVGSNTALTTLSCGGNPLTSLNVSKNTALTTLSCTNNSLTKLDVSDLTELTELTCSGNPLTSLDVSQNHKLETLYCSSCALTSLDLSGTNVTGLSAAYNSYDITLTDGTFDLDELSEFGFKASKATDWTGGTVDEDGILTLNSGETKVTYKYDCENGHSVIFTLDATPKYTVTVGGIYHSHFGNEPGETFTLDYAAGERVTLEIGKREGYTLKDLTLSGIDEEQLKWNAKDVETDQRAIGFTMPANDVTIRVNWKQTAATYTVTFDANGGSGTMTAQTTTGEYTLPECTFTAPSGKQFQGWATSASGEVIADTAITVTKNTTLYAIWGINYGVTVNDVKVTSLNKDNVIVGKKVQYDPATKTISVKDFVAGDLIVTGDGETIVNISDDLGAPAVGALTVTGAKDVTVTANSGAPAIYGEADITCTGNVTITNSNGMAASAPLTVDGAQNVTVEGSGNQAIAGKTMITCSGNVTIANSTGMAVSNQLTVTGAKDVTVTANSSAPTIAGEADITCSGKVDITNSTGMAVNSALTVNKAKDVTVIANSSYPAIGGTADITCSGKVDITNSTGMAVSDALTVKNAKDVTVTANTENTENTDYPAIGGKADITCSGDVTISNSNSDGRAVGNGLTYQSTGDHGYTVKTGPSLDSLTDYAIKEADQVFEIESLDAPAVKISVGHTADEWHSDSTQHWQVCTVCGEEFNRANHTFIGNTCTVCGYTKPSGGGSSSSGGGSSTPTYTPTVTQPENGAVTVSPKAPKKGDTVTITPKPEDGYTVEQILVTDKNGDPVKVTNNGDGTYSFTQPAGKVTVKATFMEDNSMLNFFVDVPAGAYYYDAVLWAAENGITGGVDDTHFAPNSPCTRAQIVTFLWRAAGSPEPETVSSFADVPADSYYAKAVAWAVENGITTGTGDGMFSPDATCTRAQAMAFIWRSQKSAAADGVNPFTDVAADAYYAGAVQWAVENGVTNGTSDTTFSPNTNCTRAQIVTFLFRCLGEE